MPERSPFSLPTKTPEKTTTDPGIDPDTHYFPERLCPSQRGDGEKWSRP